MERKETLVQIMYFRKLSSVESVAKYTVEFIGITEVKKSIVWRCVSRLENTGLACHSRTVLEDMIGIATVDAINKLIGQKDGFLLTLKENIETVISETDNNVVSEIDKKLEELQKDLLRLANSKEDYNDIADEIYRLREERHKALAEEAGKKKAPSKG